MSDLIARLRADLTAADFGAEALSALWGADAAAALHRGNRVPAFRSLTGPGPLATLARLFILGAPVSRREAEAALPALGVNGAVRLGLVATDRPEAGAAQESIAPLLDLRPYTFVDTQGVGSWWIASDLGEAAIGGPLPADHVLGVGGASTTLSGLMMQSPVDRALDLGTGCGIQALHAARHARHVVATDISRRAIGIARLNAELNGVDNIEFRIGSLFEPVAGELFDQIVSNPPFVITPRIPPGRQALPLYEYRDGGMVGDDLVASVLRDAKAHLSDGGTAQILGNWEYRGSADALDRVRSWIDEESAGTSGSIDAWVIERGKQDVALYAETWIRDGGTRPGPDFDELSNLWLDDFASRDVASVGFGYVTLRRNQTSGSTRIPLRRFERLTDSLGHNPVGLGQHLSASLAMHDWLSARENDALAAERLTVAGDVTEERHYWPGAEHPTVMTLRQGSGFRRTIPLTTALAAFVGACDGELTAAAIIGALSGLLEEDETRLSAELLPAIRELMLTGFLGLESS